MKKYKIGYTQGVYDMFHIGHLNLLNSAKQYCDYLIVGINSDKLVSEYKHKTPIVNEDERLEIVRNIKAVDECFIVNTLNKGLMHDQLNFDVIFIGDDWKGNPRWVETEKMLSVRGVDVVFLPYTKGVSSTQLRDKYDEKVQD